MSGTLEVRAFTVGPLDNNCYLVWDPACREAVVVCKPWRFFNACPPR